jgi:enoyl-CoA hydratase
MAGPKLLVEGHGPVTVLTLNRPEVRNCIDAETAGMLTEAIAGFADDERAAVLVVTGAGGTFCSGADLKDIEALVARRGDSVRAPLGFSDLEPEKPRISAVEGLCIAGGIELACWCDFTVAGRGARFAAFSRRWGVPWVDGGTQRMTRRVGVGHALYLVETGEEVDADRALATGLVQEVVATGGALDRAMELANRIASYPQHSLRADRASVLIAPGVSLEEGLAREAGSGRAAETDELRDGVGRFVDRRRKGRNDKGESGAADARHP